MLILSQIAFWWLRSVCLSGLEKFFVGCYHLSCVLVSSLGIILYVNSKPNWYRGFTRTPPVLRIFHFWMVSTHTRTPPVWGYIQFFHDTRQHIESGKSKPNNVCNHTFRLRCCTTLPFIFANRIDLRKSYKHTLHRGDQQKHFWRPSKSNSTVTETQFQNSQNAL